MRFRLSIDLLMTFVLMFCFSYYWLGNSVHEIAGTGFFLFVIIHNMFHVRWFRSIRKMKRGPKEFINIFITFLMSALVLVLFVTSTLISKILYGLIGINGGFTLRQIHILSAYWLLIVASIHVGLRWRYLISLLRLQETGLILKICLRIVAIGIAIQGCLSSSILGLAGKLTMQMSLDWWDFDKSPGLFFFHCACICGLWIFLTHYSLRTLDFLKHNSIYPQ